MATRSDVDRSELSVGELVTAIKDDMSGLVRGEIDLAKAELRDEAKSASVGVAAIAVAVILLAMAAVLLSIALVVVINNAGITLGWSFTIVGGGYVLVAAALGIAAKSRFGKVVGPRRTRVSVGHAAQALRPSARS